MITGCQGSGTAGGTDDGGGVSSGTDMHPAASLLLSLIGVGLLAQGLAAPPLPHLVHTFTTLCALELQCDKESGPVCAVDASGMPKNFSGDCYVFLENCVYSKNFAVVKKGEC